MTTAYGKFAALAVFTLAGVAVLVPATPAAPPEKPAPNDEERPAPQSVFAGTAIGVVLEANGNEVPKNGEEMMKTLAKLGQFAQLPVTFSAVDLHTGLAHPRVVITQRPSMSQPFAPARPGGKPVDPDDTPDVEAPVGFPGLGANPGQSSISPAKLTKPNLEGRLFLAANMEEKDGTLKVKTFEFISWNRRKMKFDFGFIECDEVEPQIRLVDGVRCFSCHKNHGPILGQGPWSNTPHNDIVRQAVATRLGVNLQSLCLPNTIGQPTRLDTGFDIGIVKQPKATFDGVSLLVPQGPAVDAAVRTGADMARDRELYRAMTTTVDGRKALVILMSAIAAPGNLEVANQQAKTALNQAFHYGYPDFAEKWVSLHKNNSSTLIDFNPSGSMGNLKQVTTGSLGGWGSGSTLQTNLQVVWSGSTQQITTYDTKRTDGEPNLPSTRQPSNPKAFVRQPVAFPTSPSLAVNATQLARLIGVTEGDRAFLAEQLTTAAKQVNKPKVTAQTLAKDVFGGPQFSEVLTAGKITDREDFKDRFVKGLNEALKAQGAAAIELARANYASGPNVALAPGKEDNEAPIVPTTTCLHCHDVRGTGKVAFNPIPMLAFDPFDTTSRDSWIKSNDAKKRAPVLARMLKRLAEDKDMPPEDSAEYDTFRVKNPAAFDAVKDWLDAELKKAKG